MITYTFECNECKKEIEKFRMGSENLARWKSGEYIVTCDCGSTNVKQVIPKGSGQFKNMKS